MGRQAQPQLTDANGVTRPAWDFPRTDVGVPRGSPMPSWVQADIEKELRVPWALRTPTSIVPPAVSLAIVWTAAAAAALTSFVPGSIVGWVQVLLFVAIMSLATLRDPGALSLALHTWSGLAVFVLLVLWSSLEPLWTAALALVAVTTAAAGFLPPRVFAAGRAGAAAPPVKPEAFCRAFLSRRRCPSCAGARLRSSVEQVLCGWCGAAWETEAVLERRRRRNECGACGYPLEGLPPNERGVVVCPECGVSALPDAPTGRADAGLRCWGCRASLAGQPVRFGDRVCCPSCGQWRSGVEPVTDGGTAAAR